MASCTAFIQTAIRYSQTKLFTSIKRASRQLIREGGEVGRDIGVQKRTCMSICRDMLRAKGFIAFTGYGEEIKGVAILLGTVSANLGKVHDGDDERDCTRGMRSAAVVCLPLLVSLIMNLIVSSLLSPVYVYFTSS